MNIKNIFGNNKVELLTNKISELEKTIAEIKSTPLNQSLAGIIGSNWVELETNRYDNAFNNNYVIYRGINILANKISTLPLIVYKGSDPLDSDFMFPNFDIQNPNPEMSLSELLYTACVYYFYRGEFMLYINQDGPKIMLEPANPRQMDRTKDKKWRWNNTLTIPDEQLIYVKLLNPDGFRGLSPVDVVKDELISDYRAGEMNKKFFENFAKLGVVLEDKLGLASLKDMQELVEQFNKTQQGSANGHKTVGLPKGISASELGQTMKEMEFLSSRKDIRDKILGILGIHSAVFGISENITYQTQKDALNQLWSLTLKPQAIRIQEKLNQHLMNRYFPGYQVYFSFDDIEELQEDMTEKINNAKGYRDLGYTLNEVNDYFDLGMDDVDDVVGNTRFIPSNLIPADEILMLPEDTKKTDLDISNTENTKIIELFDTYDNKNANIDRYKYSFGRAQRKIEKKMVSKFGRYFSEQLGKVIGIIKDNKAITKMDINVLLAMIDNFLEVDSKKLGPMMKPIYEEGSLSASTISLYSLGISLPSKVNDIIVEDMVKNISDISDYTYKLIRNEIKDAITSGESVAEMTDRVLGIYKFQASRARIIAQTESANVMNRTTNDEYVKAGVKKKVWVATNDDKTRDSHRTYGAMGAIPYNEPFNKQTGIMFPGDPQASASEIVGCRCALAGIM
jgi:HK97 family phage portal protein